MCVELECGMDECVCVRVSMICEVVMLVTIMNSDMCKDYHVIGKVGTFVVVSFV